MGQHLSEPVTTKETTSGSNSQYHYAASSMQGWRINMEDAHTTLLSLKEDKDAAFFAVFDGHGGSKVAHYCGEHLHTTITQTEQYKSSNYVDALKQGFLKCDDEMLHTDSMRDEMAGAAAIAVLLRDNKIFCSNSGDSRSVASVSGVAQELSFDHKPTNEEETKRIIAAGGWVEVSRVNGNLALSRAMGDFAFKRNATKPPEEQVVTAYPDVIVKDVTDDHEFILLACDGIWDVMANQEVVDFIRARIAKSIPPEQICEELMEHCLTPDCQMGGLGCDNMTVVLVCLLNDKSYADLAMKCAKQNEQCKTTDESKNIEGEEQTNTKEEAVKTNQSKTNEENDEQQMDIT